MEKVTGIKAFLSHSYKSSHINLFFFELLSEALEIHFDVDESTLATNVTRLERMIREADVFIGIYPIPESLGDDPQISFVENACRYFKLELDIAIRFKKPCIVFIDRRYGLIFPIISTKYVMRYDWQEISSEGEVLSLSSFKRIIADFLKETEGLILHKNLSRAALKSKDKIGVFIPELENNSCLFFSESSVDAIREIVLTTFKNKKEIEVIRPPIRLNERIYQKLETYDFVLVDMNCNSGISEFLHGYGVPMVRVDSLLIENKTRKELLTGNYTVGYPKDIISTNDKEEFLSELRERFLVIAMKTKRIKLKKDAFEYFGNATLRKETVFMSYSGKNKVEASTIIKNLKMNFIKVFNYRDKAESIAPGTSWIEEIFDSLSTSSIAIILLTDSYLNSGNCIHEMQEIVALHDDKKLKILPVKLFDNRTLSLPKILKNIQYVRYWEYDSPDIVLKSAIALLNERNS